MYSEVLGLLCATLQVLLRKLQRNDVVQIADQVMQILLYMLTSADQSSVQEDTLLAIDALVNGMTRVQLCGVYTGFVYVIGVFLLPQGWTCSGALCILQLFCPFRLLMTRMSLNHS